MRWHRSHFQFNSHRTPESLSRQGGHAAAASAFVSLCNYTLVEPFEPESCICCSLFVLHQVGGFAQSCQRGASTGLFCVHASTNEHADYRALLCTPLPRNTSVAGDGTKVAAAEEGDAFQHSGTCEFIQLPSVVQGFTSCLCWCVGANLQPCIL